MLHFNLRETHVIAKRHFDNFTDRRCVGFDDRNPIKRMAYETTYL